MNPLELANQVTQIDFERVDNVLSEIRTFRSWCTRIQEARNQEQVPWEDFTAVERGWVDAVLDRGWNRDEKWLSVQIFCREIYRSLGWKLYDVLQPVMNEVEYQGDGRGAKRRIVTSVRKSVLVRDNAECQLCGFKWILPLNTYKDIREKLRPHLSYRSSMTLEESESYNRRYRLAKGPEMDHIIPATFGGPSEGWNVWVLCHNCNQHVMADLWPPAIRLALERLRKLDPYMPMARIDQVYDPGKVPRQ